ncbi:MAG: hypothetical protein E5X69_02170 [Mesorhizobium sp.]|nr:MAG: hypothetical protein E5X69_02170 [Mesorhizobium sp.]
MVPTAPFSIDRNTILPVTVVWTLSSSKAGDQVAVLNISQDLVETTKDILQQDYTINNRLVAGDDLRSIRLPVTVYTVWHITSFQFELLRFLVATIAFLLTLPFLTDLAKTFLAKTPATPPSMIARHDIPVRVNRSPGKKLRGGGNGGRRA